MAKPELLSNKKHKDLKIITNKNAELGDAVSGSLIFPAEFMELHKEYPIFFQKDEESGEYQAISLFGFEDEQNLFIKNNRWNARSIPALMNREPFFIGFQESKDKPGEQVPVIHIDMESPRISKNDEGEALFKEDGSNTSFLDTINRNLEMIHLGLSEAKVMFDAFVKYNLLEQFTLDIEFLDGSKFQTARYYTINRANLNKLTDEAYGELHRQGFLQCAHMVLQSMSNIHPLINRKNVLSQVNS